VKIDPWESETLSLLIIHLKIYASLEFERIIC
jgi:hypothetical protein